MLLINGRCRLWAAVENERKCNNYSGLGRFYVPFVDVFLAKSRLDE
jgi:hypothetical protein